MYLHGGSVMQGKGGVSGAVSVGQNSVNYEFSVAGKANLGCGANLPIM